MRLDDLSFPMQLGFTVCLSQEILARERATQQIEQLEAFYIWVWNPGSKTIVLSMWQEYSQHLPEENFHPQKPFLQKLADQFKTPLPKRIIDRKILEVIREEYYRLTNCGNPESIWELSEHVEKLSAIMRILESRTGQCGHQGHGVPGPAPQHYNCRSIDVPILAPGNFADSIIQRMTQRVVESMGQRMEQEFRRRVYGEPPPQAENNDHVVDSLQYMAHASSLTAADIRAVEVMSRQPDELWIKDVRIRHFEALQRQNPKLKLGEINRILKDRGHQPSLDHEESKVMPGMSKGVAGYILLNDKLKTMLDGLCDLNTWKPNV